MKGFRPLGIDGNHIFGDWFEILGRSEVDSLGLLTFMRPGKLGTFDRFGWMVVGGKVEYTATDSLVLEGSSRGLLDGGEGRLAQRCFESGR